MNLDFLHKFSSSDYATIISSFLGAFFAFIFFIFGEYLLTKHRERKALLWEVLKISDDIINWTYFFHINMRECEEIVKIHEPITLLLNRFIAFPLEGWMYSKINTLRVRVTLVSFEVYLREYNETIYRVNEQIGLMNEFAKWIMVQDLEQDKYREAMSVNLEKLKIGVQQMNDNFKKLTEKTDRIQAELNYTSIMLQSFFIKRLYVWIRMKVNKNYREEKIQSILDAYKK